MPHAGTTAADKASKAYDDDACCDTNHDFLLVHPHHVERQFLTRKFQVVLCEVNSVVHFIKYE